MIDISVVVPTFNRKEGLAKCVRSLIRQDYPRDRFEIIIVDDGSKEKLEGFTGLGQDSGNAPLPAIRIFRQENQGPAAARNWGVRLAEGDIVAFIDDDCEAYPDWLTRMVKDHKAHPDLVAVGGATLTAIQKASVIVGQFLSTCSIEVEMAGKGELIFFPTCNVSCKKSLFSRHAFDEKFPLPGGEDLEFFWRIFQAGCRSFWDKNIKVIHYRDPSLSSLARQAYIYGRGNLLVKHLHPSHILLQELRTGPFSFWAATIVNVLKIPRFCYLLGKKLTREYSIKSFWKKTAVTGCFALHKVAYLCGNIAEFFRIRTGKETFLAGEMPLPRLLIMDLTHACNLRCNICDIWKTAETKKDLDTSAVKKLLREARELGIKEIALSGGEVLLRKDVFEILDYAEMLGLKDLGILSNGVVVRERFERLKPYLTNRTLSLVVSLDSLSPALHNEIRNSADAWQRTREGLTLLSNLKKDCPEINFNVISIILNQNLEELRSLAEYVLSLKANSLQFQALLPNNLKMAERKKSKYWVPREKIPVLREALRQLIEFKRAHPDFVKNSTDNLRLIEKYYEGCLSSKDVRCASAAETVLISNQGEYATCFSVYGHAATQSLKEVLAGSKRITANEQVQKCGWPCLLPCFCDSK
jgi:glycosyltransferase involved in cell wall biosynthesis